MTPVHVVLHRTMAVGEDTCGTVSAEGLPKSLTKN